MSKINKLLASFILVLVLAMPMVTFAPTSVKAESNTTTIVDEDTPLAAAEDLCAVHWIALILTIAAGSYTAIRVVSASRQESEAVSHEMI